MSEREDHREPVNTNIAEGNDTPNIRLVSDDNDKNSRDNQVNEENDGGLSPAGDNDSNIGMKGAKAGQIPQCTSQITGNIGKVSPAGDSPNREMDGEEKSKLGEKEGNGDGKTSEGAKSPNNGIKDDSNGQTSEGKTYSSKVIMVFAIVNTVLLSVIVFQNHQSSKPQTPETNNCLKTLDLSKRDLKIPYGRYNEDNCIQLHLKDKSNIELVEIGNNTFQNVKSVVIDNLNSLKTLKVGMNSFTQAKNSFGQDSSRSFTVSNCHKLTSIELDRFAFSDFSGFNLESWNEICCVMCRFGCAGVACVRCSSEGLVQFPLCLAPADK